MRYVFSYAVQMKMIIDRTDLLNRYKIMSGAKKNMRRGDEFAMIAIRP